MGRVQGYATEQVVRAARTVFWEHGYEGASLPALEGATGLNRSSIYHAFGSKRGLFDAAVASYLDEVVRPRLRPLTESDVAPGALEEYLTGLREALRRASSFTAVNGCLLLNAAGAPIARDAAVREVVAAYRAELRAAMVAGVRAATGVRAAVGPDAESDAEIERLAEACTALVVQALALTRVDHDGALRSLDTALALVRAWGPQGRSCSRPPGASEMFNAMATSAGACGMVCRRLKEDAPPGCHQLRAGDRQTRSR